MKILFQSLRAVIGSAINIGCTASSESIAPRTVTENVSEAVFAPPEPNMDKWEGKVAVITGASEGCGAAIAVDLVKCGMIVVGLARRPEKINELMEKIPETATGQLHALKCDVRSEEDIKSAFAWVEENLNGTDVLINNAAIIRPGYMLDEDNTEMLRSVIETNLIGVALCTREAFKSMKNKDLGHVIMINSVSGHKVFYSVGAMPSFNVYAPSKHGMTALVEVLRQECQSLKTNVRISVRPNCLRVSF